MTIVTNVPSTVFITEHHAGLTTVHIDAPTRELQHRRGSPLPSG